MPNFKPEMLNGIPIPYKSSVADLKNIIKSPDTSAWAAIRALAEKNDPEALKVLSELTHSSDWRFRRSAVEAIGINPLGKQANADIERLMYDPSEYVKRSAMEVAASLGLNHAHERILVLTKASEPNTRIVALSAIEKLWQPTDFNLVFDIYMHASSDKIQKQAAQTIHSNINSEHWRLLFSVWSKDNIPRHRIWACELIKMFGNLSDFPLLLSLVNDQDGHVRKAAQRIAEFLSSSED